MAIVYRHIRLDKNEPFYIGIGLSEKRAFEKRRRNIHWHNIIEKTDYEVEILFDDLTWEEACEKEQEFISLYGRKDLGTGILVNMTDGDGGDGTLGLTPWNKGVEMLQEQKDKLSEINKGKKHSQETKDKMSKSRTGRVTTDETKRKIAESMIGKNTTTPSEETREKISKANKGKKRSEETKLKMSEASILREAKRRLAKQNI